MRAYLHTGLLVLLAMAAAKPAAAEPDDGSCRNGNFSSLNAGLGMASIDGAGRAYLLYDMDGCPQASVQCQKQGEGYVLPGDKVFTGRTRGDFVCAFYPNRGGGSAGWVDKSRLRQMPVEDNPPLSTWIGHWSDDGNPDFDITHRAGSVHVTGHAYWPGPVPRKDWPSGWPHIGEIDGKLDIRGNRAHYADDDCTLDITMLGDMLVAHDNGSCGGMNVRFDGFYRRVPR